MSRANITKLSAFVIVVLSLVAMAACGRLMSEIRPANNSGPYEPPVRTGKLESRKIRESSGLAASKCLDNVYWTHNDSGDGPSIFAIDGEGKHLGEWRVDGASNDDWEDIAATSEDGGCYIYIGEIGNNDADKTELKVIRVQEPDLATSLGDRDVKDRDLPATAAAEIIRFRYPDRPSDAEALLVHPTTGDIYVVTKRFNGPAEVFRIDRNGNGPATKLADISVPALPNGLITAGDISPDGRRVALADYFSGYEMVLPDGEDDFDQIWKQLPTRVNVGERRRGEAIAYSKDGNSLITTTEGRNSDIYRAVRKQD